MSAVLTSEEGKRVSGDWGYPLAVPVSSQLHVKQVWTGIEVISVQEWYRVLLLLQSLDDSGTTLGECLGRTQWSSPLELATYLYYFTSGCASIITFIMCPSRTFYDYMTLSHDMII